MIINKDTSVDLMIPSYYTSMLWTLDPFLHSFHHRSGGSPRIVILLAPHHFIIIFLVIITLISRTAFYLCRWHKSGDMPVFNFVSSTD